MGSFFVTKPLINCVYAIKLEVLITYANTRVTIIAEVRPRRVESALTPDDICEHLVMQSKTPKAGKLSEPQAKSIVVLEPLKVLQLSQKPELPSSKLQNESSLQGEDVEHILSESCIQFTEPENAPLVHDGWVPIA
jgi:hypothetical protein